MGVRLRTTLVATAVVAVALILASVALLAALDASLATSTKKLAVLDAKQHAVQMIHSTGAADDHGKWVPSDRDRAVEKSLLEDHHGRWYVAGAPLPGKAPAGPPKDVRAGTADHPAEAHKAAKAGKIEVTKMVITHDGPVIVTGTASTEPARAALGTLRKLLLPGVPTLLALVALATWFAVGRALRPVSAIRAKVADITAYDLHERVPVPDTRDEVAALARTVNATLDRLRTAVEAHRQFVADAAHELRSPMAILRTRLELASPPSGDAAKRLVADALDDVERLQSLTTDLLLLARLDAREPLRAKELDLAQVVAEEGARRRPRAEVRVMLDLAPDLLVKGSPDQLRRLVANLVDNAVRHATGTVRVTLAAEAGQAILDVTDDGPGIPSEHHTTVFDRFTRLDHARARDTGGSGLGLPIARDIARAHEGTLGVVPGDEGAHLRAVIPLAEAAVPRGQAARRPERAVLAAR